MKKLKYVYYISYVYTNGGGLGFGSATIYRANKIDSEEEIVSVRKYIEEQCKCSTVVIVNTILLNKKGKRA